jgi:CRP-like cAMP-binding protein
MEVYGGIRRKDVRYLTFMNKYNILDQLFSIEPFKGLNSKDQAECIEICKPRSIQKKKDEYILRDVSSQSDLHILMEGTLVSEILTPSGRLLSVKRVTAPNLVGAAMLFLPEERKKNLGLSPTIAIKAASDAQLILIPENNFLKSMHEIPALMESFLHFNSMRFYDLSGRYSFLSLGSIRRKFAFYLLQLAADQGDQEDLAISQSREELAGRFGVERPSLSAVIGEMEQEGIIARKGTRSIQILDVSALEDIVCS